LFFGQFEMQIRHLGFPVSTGWANQVGMWTEKMRQFLRAGPGARACRRSPNRQ